MKIIRIVIVLFSFAILSGCITYKPKDLKISSLTKIDKRNLLLTIKDPIRDDWIEGDFIIVKLTTKLDLIKYTQKEHYLLNYKANFCEEPSSPLLTFGLYVERRSDTKKLEKIIGDNYLDIVNAIDFSYLNYYVLVPSQFSRDVEIYGRPEREDAVFYKKYNLMKQPRDLCIQIGGEYFGVGFQSNSVVLPRKKLEQILLKH